ncbi:hypothetical protein NL479_28530, partial [Klebsiella pneumoniae]|nr:hypothetical protein [Klebsiella pneumoniae]
ILQCTISTIGAVVGFSFGVWVVADGIAHAVMAFQTAGDAGVRGVGRTTGSIVVVFGNRALMHGKADVV